MVAIGLVAAMFIGGQVRQRAAVMRRQEIDGPRRRSAMENVGRSREPGRQRADHAAIPAPETAHVIARAVVPFQPPFTEPADLLAAGAELGRATGRDRVWPYL